MIRGLRHLVVTGAAVSALLCAMVPDASGTEAPDVSSASSTTAASTVGKTVHQCGYAQSRHRIENGEISGDITGTQGHPGRIGVGYAKFGGPKVRIRLGWENAFGARFTNSEVREIGPGQSWFGPVWDSWLDDKVVWPYVWVEGAANPIFGSFVIASPC